MKSFRKIKYDEAHLYVEETSQDIQIPFEHIKQVELVSLDGIYRFELSHPQSFGIFVYCKPSMWYPFNYAKVDEELNLIRDLIAKRKEIAREESGLLLNSMNL